MSWWEYMAADEALDYMGLHGASYFKQHPSSRVNFPKITYNVWIRSRT